MAAESAWLGAPSFWMPRHFTVSAWVEHAPFAYWITSVTRPRSLVELGTHFGFSYFTFCEAIVRLGLETSAFALDTWQGDDHAGLYGEEVYQSVSRINESEYGQFSRLLRGYFDDSLDKIPDGSIDLIHFDGRHGLEDIRHDFASWLPKISTRGVALFHDIAEHQAGFGVWQFWDEVELQYPAFAFEHAHGLGVLGVGKDLAPEMANFFTAAKEQPGRVRARYESLGAVVSRQATIDERATHVEELAAALADSRGELNRKEAAILDLERQLDEMRTSTSWKVTRPVRAMGSIIRRP